MKKTLITWLALVGCVVAVSAQEADRTKGVETKKGYNILPAEGDFALGVDATPFLEYGIGLFSGSTAPTFGYNGSIYGKYFTRDNQAIRFRLKIDTGSNLKRTIVADDQAIAANPLDPYATTFDVQTHTRSNYGFYGGYEWRRGYGRLQAFFGGEAGINFYSEKYTYKWGNPMTSLNQTPTSDATWAGNSNPTQRILDIKNGKGIGFNLGAFVGVEYFVARKISLGGQVGLDFGYNNLGQSTHRFQYYNPAKNEVEERTSRIAGGDREWTLQTTVAGNIFLMFHF